MCERQDGADAAALEAQADQYFIAGALAQALACQVQAIELRARAGDWLAAGAGAQSEGLLRSMLNDFHGATDAYRCAYKARRRAGDKHGQGVTLCRMAEVFQQMGRHRQALRLLHASLRPFAQSNGVRELGVVMNNIGVSYRELGALDTSQRYYVHSLELRHKVGDHDGFAATLLNLSVVHYDQQLYAQAKALLDEAQQIREAMGDRKGLGQIALQMGLLLEEQQDGVLATEYFMQALDLARESHSLSDEAVALLNLASAVVTDDFDHGWALFDQAELLFTQLVMNVGIALADRGRGRALAASGQSLKALAHLEAARARLLKLDDQPRLVVTHVEIGRLHAQHGQHKKALEEFTAAHTLQKRLFPYSDEASTLRLISEACEAMGDTIGARSAREEAAGLSAYVPSQEGGITETRISKPSPSHLSDEHTPDSSTLH